MPTWFAAFSITIVIVWVLGCAGWIVVTRGWIATDPTARSAQKPEGDPKVHIERSIAGSRIGPLTRRTASGATLDLYENLVVVTTMPFRGSTMWSFDRPSLGSLRVTAVPSGSHLRLYDHDGRRIAVVYLAHTVGSVRQYLARAGWLVLLAR